MLHGPNTEIKAMFLQHGRMLIDLVTHQTRSGISPSPGVVKVSHRRCTLCNNGLKYSSARVGSGLKKPQLGRAAGNHNAVHVQSRFSYKGGSGSTLLQKPQNSVVTPQ